MFIVDSHCHLNFDDFKNDFNQVLLNAQNNNVKLMQTICTHLGEFAEVLKIAENHENIYCSVGLHPCSTLEEEIPSIEKLVSLANHPKVIGFGETGLDYYHQPFSKEKQVENFLNHIEAARICNLPVIIHTRDADEDTIEILQSEMNKKPFKALVHCFTGTDKLAKAVIDLNQFISVSGIITFKNAKALQDVVKNIPIENLLIETDAPYLAPTPNRGKRNEPAFTYFVAEYLANMKNILTEEVAIITTNNFFNLFDKVDRKKFGI